MDIGFGVFYFGRTSVWLQEVIHQKKKERNVRYILLYLQKTQLFWKIVSFE